MQKGGLSCHWWFCPKVDKPTTDMAWLVLIELLVKSLVKKTNVTLAKVEQAFPGKLASAHPGAEERVLPQSAPGLQKVRMRWLLGTKHMSYFYWFNLHQNRQWKKIRRQPWVLESSFLLCLLGRKCPKSCTISLIKLRPERDDYHCLFLPVLRQGRKESH